MTEASNTGALVLQNSWERRGSDKQDAAKTDDDSKGGDGGHAQQENNNQDASEDAEEDSENKTQTSQSKNSSGDVSKPVDTMLQALAVSPLPVVAWDHFHILGTLAHGRYATVFMIEYQGTKLALKLFDVSKHSDDMFQAEVAAYAAVRNSAAAECVPEPAFLTETPSGICVGLAMELGVPLPDNFDKWSHSQRKAAFQCIDLMVQHAGIVHGDVHASNFVASALVPERVLAIDFENAVRCV